MNQTRGTTSKTRIYNGNMLKQGDGSPVFQIIRKTREPSRCLPKKGDWNDDCCL